MAYSLVQLRLPVVGFDLGGQWVPVEAERSDEFAGNGGPVLARVRCHMGSEGAGRTAELSEVFGRFHLRQNAP